MRPRHIVIIGAARSGTKLLRDMLAETTGAGSVPYDVGYVWRVGNESIAHDRLDPMTITPKTRRFIARFVDGYAAGSPPAVIEKTVGNALRVPFVATVFPDARFVHLIRDGVDVTESTLRQWTAPTDWRYIAAKARHFPARLVPSYGARYVGSLVSRFGRSDRRVGSWGPRYPGIDNDLATEDLLVVCARQWRESVERSCDAFAGLEQPVHEVRYEAMVQDPVGTIKELAEFLDLTVSERALSHAATRIEPEHTGRGRAALAVTDRRAVARELSPLLNALGYAPLDVDPSGASQ